MFVNQIWGIIAVKGVYIGQYVRFSLHSHININIHPQYRLSVSSIRYVVFVKKAKTVCGTVCCAVIVEVQVNLHNKTLNTRGETVHRSHGSVSNFFRVRYNFVTVGWKQTNKQKIQARFLYWCAGSARFPSYSTWDTCYSLLCTKQQRVKVHIVVSHMFYSAMSLALPSFTCRGHSSTVLVSVLPLHYSC